MCWECHILNNLLYSKIIGKITSYSPLSILLVIFFFFCRLSLGWRNSFLSIVCGEFHQKWNLAIRFLHLLNLSFQQFDYCVSWHVFSSSFSCLGFIELDCEFSILIKFRKFSSIIFSNAVFSLYLIFSIFFPFVFHLES